MKATTSFSPSIAEHASARLAGDGYLRIRDVLALVPVSRSVWWQGIREGRYPKGVKLSLRATAWRCEDIRTLLDQLAEAPHQRAA